MSLSTETLTVLLVLLPGFVCAKLIRWLCPRPQQTEMEKLVDALLYSFIVYAIFTLIFGTFQQMTRLRIAVLAVIPLGIAVVAAYVMTNDSVGRLLRKFRITHRTTRPSVWHDVFHKYGGYALVELGDGRLVFGWVEFYSDFPSPPSLFLEDACWVESDTGNRRQIDGAGILITGDIKTISFHHAKDTRQSKGELSESADATQNPLADNGSERGVKASSARCET